MPDIVNAKRVGQPRENKPRLVQVTLKSEEQVKMVIHSAKQLRRSRNGTTRKTVFINPDYMKAEARANYKIRQKKRQAKTVATLNEVESDQPSALNPEAAFFAVSTAYTGSDIHSSDCQPVRPTFGDVVNGHVAAGDENDDGKVSRIAIGDRVPDGITDDVHSATSSQDA